MKNLTLLCTTIVATTAGAMGGNIQAASALSWNWGYMGTGISANGTFITEDTPDSLGFYLITQITGTRNGETIIGLQEAGTSIPGNEPFLVDNLISLNNVQLTGEGFGYFTDAGNYVTPFFASFLNPPEYLEVFSAPPLIPGFENFGPEDSELPITFWARPIIVSEPAHNLGLLFLGTLVLTSILKSSRSIY